uniref:Uncharacterized protein n=1 Tax=Cacopsylla melanoneura TaxID=428564 RepID=A0A8D8M219_9HEMI
MVTRLQMMDKTLLRMTLEHTQFTLEDLHDVTQRVQILYKAFIFMCSVDFQYNSLICVVFGSTIISFNCPMFDFQYVINCCYVIPVSVFFHSVIMIVFQNWCCTFVCFNNYFPINEFYNSPTIFFTFVYIFINLF